MDRGGLCTILERVHGSETTVAAKRVAWITVARGTAEDALFAPVEDGIEQAHAASMGNELADRHLIHQHGVYRTLRPSVS